TLGRWRRNGDERHERIIASTMDDLHARVDEWLQNQGFPLEFRTARALSVEGRLRAVQGTYVRDPITYQLREVDVVASIHLEATDVICRVSVVAECKWSRKKPWILFTSPNAGLSREEGISYLVGSAFAAGALWHMSTDQNLQNYNHHRRLAR